MMMEEKKKKKKKKTAVMMENYRMNEINSGHHSREDKRKMSKEKDACVGKFPCQSDEKLVDDEHSYQWLKFGEMKGRTESTIFTAQDQAISTNYFKNKILKEQIDSKC
jgi:hypothetical protein